MRCRSSSLAVTGAALLAWGPAIPAATASARAATVHAASASGLGKILVSATGRTLYETLGSGAAAACSGSCALRWHPLVIAAKAKPIAGVGARPALLGTKKRADGRVQVTYDGRALYLFAGDTRSSSVAGQNVGGVWHAISPSGNAVLTVVTNQTATSSPPAGMPSGSGLGSSTGSGTTTDPSMSAPPISTVNPAMWCAAKPKSCVNGVPIPGSG